MKKKGIRPIKPGFDEIESRKKKLRKGLEIGLQDKSFKNAGGWGEA